MTDKEEDDAMVCQEEDVGEWARYVHFINDMLSFATGKSSPLSSRDELILRSISRDSTHPLHDLALDFLFGRISSFSAAQHPSIFPALIAVLFFREHSNHVQ